MFYRNCFAPLWPNPLFLSSQSITPSHSLRNFIADFIVYTINNSGKRKVALQTKAVSSILHSSTDMGKIRGSINPKLSHVYEEDERPHEWKLLSDISIRAMIGQGTFSHLIIASFQYSFLFHILPTLQTLQK